MHAQSLQSCLTLCDPTDCGPPAPSVRGVLQARILEWVASPPPGDLLNTGIRPMSPVSPALQADPLSTEPPGTPSKGTLLHLGQWWRKLRLATEYLFLIEKDFHLILWQTLYHLLYLSRQLFQHFQNFQAIVQLSMMLFLETRGQFPWRQNCRLFPQ